MPRPVTCIILHRSRRTLSRTGRTQRNYPRLSGSPAARPEQPMLAVLFRQALLPTGNGRRSLRYPLDRRRTYRINWSITIRSWPILFLRKQHMEQAVAELKKALHFKKRVVVPYVCTACQQESTEWSGRCRRCGTWNTLVALPWLEGGQAQDKTAPHSHSQPFPTKALLLPSKPCRFSASLQAASQMRFLRIPVNAT